MRVQASLNPSAVPAVLPLRQLLLCSAAIVTVAMGVRHGFGLWLDPVTMDRGWTRETFAFAVAVQNLAWGAAGPLTGMVADRWGAFRVLVAGALLYAAGLVFMTQAASGLTFALTAGLMIGVAQSGTTYAVVYGVIGRNIAAEKRSWAMGLTAAAGSFGQFLMVPVESWMIATFGWREALVMLGGIALLMIPLARGLREPALASGALPGSGRGQTAAQALREAAAHPSFLLLTAGYFVCGFQVVFIGVHMPSFLKDQGLGPEVATTALALIGLFNVFGTYTTGLLGQRLPKHHILATIYLLRSVVIVIFLAAPPTPLSVYVFSAVMGLLWLSTVPPTNAVVAQVFGVRHLSMLGGIVFLSHQIGSFMGVWLGGRLYDATGSYDTVWWISIALGVVACALNLPIRESPVIRAPSQTL